MSNLKTCSRCKSTIHESYFSMNRKKELYKTCDKCRNHKNKNNKNNEITQQHYEKVDKDMRELYEKEFKINSFNKDYSIFSRDEQIERYANMLAFWEKNMPIMNTKGCSECCLDPYEIAKMSYISEMKSQLESRITLFDNELSELMN